jgi:hypothetical protein
LIVLTSRLRLHQLVPSCSRYLLKDPGQTTDELVD